MSDRNRRTKNNVTYLNRNNHKTTSNRQKINSKKRVSKKRKVNIKNLLILIIAMLTVVIISIKTTQGISALVKNISTDKENVTEEKVSELEHQFDLNEEGVVPITKYTIYIDPGHGGEDNGMQNKETKIYEKEITLGIGRKLNEKLSRQTDIDVIMGRTDNTKTATIKERVEEAKKAKADIIISLQLNSEYNGNTASGIDIFYNEDGVNDTRELANIIKESILSFVEVKDRGVGVGSFGILKESTIPAININCGFITNPEEVKKLTNEEYLNEFTEGIAQGIFSYIDAKK